MKQIIRNIVPTEAHRFLWNMKNGLLSGREHRKLMERRVQGGRYLAVRVDTVSACNHRCQYCYTLDLTGHRTQLMSLEDFEKTAKRLFPYAHSLALSCAWEPTMNKKLADFIRVAARYDVPYIHFVSNGAFLTDEMLEAMVDCGVARMAVSIDAATPELYEKIREVNDLERVLSNLAKLKELKAARGVSKPVVNINWTAFEENADEAVIFARKHGDLFDTFWFWHLLPRMRNTVNPFNRMDRKRFYSVVRQLRAILGDRLTSSEFNEDESNKPLGTCNRSLENIRVNPTGELEVTCSKHILNGNIFTEDFADIYARNEDLFEKLYKKETDFCQNDCDR